MSTQNLLEQVSSYSYYIRYICSNSCLLYFNSNLISTISYIHFHDRGWTSIKCSALIPNHNSYLYPTEHWTWGLLVDFKHEENEEALRVCFDLKQRRIKERKTMGRTEILLTHFSFACLSISSFKTKEKKIEFSCFFPSIFL